MIDLNILIIGSERTGKTILSNALYEHPSVLNYPTSAQSTSKKAPPQLNNLTSITQRYNLKILSTTSYDNIKTSIKSNEKNKKGKKSFDFIICIFDITNFKSWNFIKSFLMDNNELDVEYFSMNKIVIVVTREDLKHELLSIPFNELDSICDQFNIQFYLSNLTNLSSLQLLVDKIINQISLNHYNLINTDNYDHRFQINKLLFDTLDIPFINSTEINN